MKRLILLLNYYLFYWYYKRVPKHFHSWTFIKSVKVLISNYEHQKYCLKSQEELIGKFIEIGRDRDAELHNLRMQRIATPEQINWANKTFGTKFKQADEN